MLVWMFYRVNGSLALSVCLPVCLSVWWHCPLCVCAIRSRDRCVCVEGGTCVLLCCIVLAAM